MLISSAKNETIKRLRSLKERASRRETGLHLIEGERLVFDALDSGAKPDTLLIEVGREALKARASALGLPFLSVSRNVLEAVCDTPSPQGICAAMHTPDTTPPDDYSLLLTESDCGMLVALDAIQDPGNLGAILRTADAMGAIGILLGNGCTDAFSPKALRAAMGSTYHIPVFCGELCGELKKLRQQGFVLVCGHLRGEEHVPSIGRRCAVVIGNEGSGVSDEAASLCELYRLPMYGRAESLNVSVAASILIYELAKLIRA